MITRRAIVVALALLPFSGMARAEGFEVKPLAVSEMQAEGCDQAMSRTPSGPKSA